ncbi:hypothetical protein [Lacticaseibacillus sp. GG6-2]
MINKPQHQKKSDRSLWLRFVYAFATIVTIFAQMSAAAPLLLTDAAGVSTSQNGMLLADKNGYSAGDTAAITVTPQPDSDGPFTLSYDASKLTYDQTTTEHNMGTSAVVAVNVNGNDSVHVSPVGPGTKVKVYFKVKSSLSSGAALTLHDGLTPSGAVLGAATLKAPGTMDAQQVLGTYKAPTDSTPPDSTTNTDANSDSVIHLETSGLTPTKNNNGVITSYRVTLSVTGTNALTGKMVDGKLPNGTLGQIAQGDSFTISWKGADGKSGVTPLQSEFEKALNDKGFYFDWSNVAKDEV